MSKVEHFINNTTYVSLFVENTLKINYSICRKCLFYEGLSLNDDSNKQQSLKQIKQAVLKDIE